MAEARDWAAIGKSVAAVARENRIGLAAAGLAYYVFGSLVPLVVLVVVAATAVDLVAVLVPVLDSVPGLEGIPFEFVLDVVRTEAGRHRAIGIATVVFLWSTVTMFRSIDVAFCDVYGTRDSDVPVRRTVVDVLLTLATVVVAFAAFAGVGLALAVTGDGPAWSVLSVPLLFAVLVVAFLPMYFRFPGTEVTVREALPGAIAAAAAWTVSALVFRAYATLSASVELYGVIGGLLLLLTWLYVGGLTLLLGAVVNAVLAGRVEASEEWIPEAPEWIPTST